MHVYAQSPHVINIRQSQRADTHRADGHSNTIYSIKPHEAASQNVQHIIAPIQPITLRMIGFSKPLESSIPINPPYILSGPIP